jgi:diacylglycerol kinase
VANRDAVNPVPVFCCAKRIRGIDNTLFHRVEWAFMAVLHTSVNALYVSRILVAAFLAILFLQSGIDKLVDRHGNLEWLKGHFAKSPLAGTVPALLTVITVLEIAAGALSALGCLVLLVTRDSTVAYYGAVVSGIAITGLFFGQRMAKDYAGAAVLVPYILVTLLAIDLLGHG